MDRSGAAVWEKCTLQTTLRAHGVKAGCLQAWVIVSSRSNILQRHTTEYRVNLDQRTSSERIPHCFPHVHTEH